MSASHSQTLLVSTLMLGLSGCAGPMPESLLTTGPLTTGSVATDTAAARQTAGEVARADARGTKVVANAPTRVFVVAGLDARCRATGQPAIVITQPPGKGTVSLKAVPPTTMQFTLSGKCIGQRVPGVGVYYQARDGEVGVDTFTFAVKIGRAEPLIKTIPVVISN
jgi:hypothetical protein